MQNGTFLLSSALGERGTRQRIVVMIAIVTLVFAMFVVVQNVDVSPAGAKAVSTASVSGDSAQIDLRQIVCPILIAVRNAFASTPFGGFVTPILNALLAAFGCAPS